MRIFKKFTAAAILLAAVILLPMVSYAQIIDQGNGGVQSESITNTGNEGAQSESLTTGSGNTQTEMAGGPGNAEVSQLPGGSISPVSITLNYGFENNAKGGRYMPLNITYTNGGPADFEGNISIYSRESDDKICEYKNEIMLAEDQSMEVTYYIPLGIRATSLHLRLTDNAGNICIDRDIDLNIDDNNAQLFIGVLSDTPEKLSYFNDVSLHYGLLRSRTFNLDAETFPHRSRGLDMLDMIIISNYKIRNLDETQSHALMEWVREGGVLVLGTGERIDDTLGRYAPELLDDMYDIPELCEVDLTTGPEMGSPDNDYVELYCTEVDLHGGNVEMQDNGLPLLTASNKENGLIVVAAYDFADVSDYAAQHKTYPVDVLTACLGEERMDYLAGEIYGTDNTRYDNISSLVSRGDTGRIPPVGVYALSIAAFILLAGPVLYLFLKQRNLSAVYRVGVVALSVFFTAIIYLVGSRTRFDNTFYNFTTIAEADEETIKETTYLNLRNPYNRKYSVSVNPDYTIYPVRKNEAVSRISEDWSDPIDVSTLISRRTGSVDITVGEVGAFSPQYFSLEKTSDNEDGQGFTGGVNLYGNELEGVITNNFGFDIADASMIFYGKVVKLGNIASGQTVQLDGLKVVTVPLSSGREVAGTVVDDPEKADTIAFYRDMYMKGYSTDVRIIGFRNEDREAAGALVSNADLNGRGLCLAGSTLETGNYSEDRIYRSVLVKGPKVISGSYNYQYNTMTIGEPCVLEYQLGGDMQILNVVFEWADPETFSKLFEGTVSLYNYTTGSYEGIDTGKTVYDIDSLSQYLSPANTVTMRYTYQGTLPSGEDVALPMVCVVGTENGS